MSEAIRISSDGAVTTITLDRPEKLNPLSAALVEQMQNAIDIAAGDGTRLLVLRGNGRAFSAGFDFDGLESHSDADLALRFIRIELLLQSIHHAPFSTLALVHGSCFGAAADIVCCCDMRIAEAGTRFRMPGLQFGVVLGTRRLREVVGRTHALELLEGSPVFDATQALALGFLTKIAVKTDWPSEVQTARDRSLAMSTSAAAQMRARLTPDRRDQDLAALVRSVGVAGLRERIKTFRSRQ